MVLGGAAIQRCDQARNRISPVPAGRETETASFFAPAALRQCFGPSMIKCGGA